MADLLAFLPDFKTLLLICPLIFLSGLVDGVAGGGGLISLPTYIFAGVPIHLAYGTNKFANGIGMLSSTVQYLKGGHYDLKLGAASSCSALFGSLLGVNLALLLSERYLQICLMVLLPLVAGFLLLNKDFGNSANVKKLSRTKLYVFAVIIGLVCGAYDGFFGPATGTFLVLGFTQILGFDMLTAAGNGKIVNLASNLMALVVFLLNGKVLFGLAVPAAICSLLGNAVGAKLAIKKGTKFIKPVILLVVALLFIKIIFDFFK